MASGMNRGMDQSQDGKREIKAFPYRRYLKIVSLKRSKWTAPFPKIRVSFSEASAFVLGTLFN